ncbi:putative methyltransferase [Trachipleistophora hominis]|uniref:Putative methyltransferase n=1 Tax=Trachipleistophora hominis TaxID=72359 RepID=L7JZ18_TRAHO|nr:putative methyltransferase [Trachipleistophora hominis]
MLLRDRKLVDLANKNDFNAWDKEEIKDDVLEKALKKVNDDNLCISRNSFEINSKKSWDKFYRMHKDNFFKKRKWLIEEFKDILNRRRILELGCGVGSSLHHFLKINEEENSATSARGESRFDVHGCDFSPQAISIYQQKYKGVFFVHDLISDTPLPAVLMRYFSFSLCRPSSRNTMPIS